MKESVLKKLCNQVEIESYRDFLAAGMEISIDNSGFILTIWNDQGTDREVSEHGNFYDLAQKAYKAIK